MLDGKKTYLALALALLAKLISVWQTGEPGISDGEIVELAEWASAAGVFAGFRDAIRKLIEARRPAPSGREPAR